MPTMADISVKKADETTSITYSQVVASAGDRSPSVWKCTSVGSAPAHNPSLTGVSRWNEKKTARRLEFTYAYPQTATAADGSIGVINIIPIDMAAVIPQGVPQTIIDEAVAQAMNLFASTLVKASCKSGYTPT